MGTVPRMIIVRPFSRSVAVACSLAIALAGCTSASPLGASPTPASNSVRLIDQGGQGEQIFKFRALREWDLQYAYDCSRSTKFSSSGELLVSTAPWGAPSSGGFFVNIAPTATYLVANSARVAGPMSRLSRSAGNALTGKTWCSALGV